MSLIVPQNSLFSGRFFNLFKPALWGTAGKVALAFVAGVACMAVVGASSGVGRKQATEATQPKSIAAAAKRDQVRVIPMTREATADTSADANSGSARRGTKPAPQGSKLVPAAAAANQTAAVDIPMPEPRPDVTVASDVKAAAAPEVTSDDPPARMSKPARVSKKASRRERRRLRRQERARLRQQREEARAARREEAGGARRGVVRVYRYSNGRRVVLYDGDDRRVYIMRPPARVERPPLDMFD